jgi:S-adenosylmethionine synthetase
MGVDRKKPEDQGAGDQGMMFGYATNESIEYMPLTLVISRQIINELQRMRRDQLFVGLRPDAKAQVTIEYSDDGKPIRVDTILVSQQHDPDIEQIEIESLVDMIIQESIIPEYMDRISFDGYKLLVNPTGQFIIGGPAGDTGLTGRKIIVDTYGGACPHGGGAFSGKDPSKVDRSAAYMCRYVAKHLVAAGVADRLCLQVSYAIGKKEPISFMVNTYGTAKNGLNDTYIAEKIPELFDFTPYGIITSLDLKEPRYLKTAKFGHFTIGFAYPWEIVWDNEVGEIKKMFNLN